MKGSNQNNNQQYQEGLFMFRRLSEIPPFDNVYLHSIPGRNESWPEFLEGLKEMSIDVLVNLVS